MSTETIEEAKTVATAAPRPLGALFVLGGIAHLLVPGLLLWLAGLGYERVLGVAFRPREHATRRVRLVGAGMIAAGAHLLYYGGVLPDTGGYKKLKNFGAPVGSNIFTNL